MTMKKTEQIVAAAYDYKAALDLAAAFLRSGLTAELFCTKEYRPGAAQAVIFDTESFFLPEEEEYALLYRLFSSAGKNALCFFKTDSSLRGNVGAELAALRDASGAKPLLFVPAFLPARKFTRAGRQYQLTEGESVCDIADASEKIAGFRSTPCFCGPCEAVRQQSGIFVLDCAGETQFEELTAWLGSRPLTALAGTSSLAGKMHSVCGLTPEQAPFGGDTAPLRVDGAAGILSLSALEWKEML